MSNRNTVFERLMAVIEDRKRERPAGSYTVGLLEGGVDAIGTKIREEAAELAEAARRADEGRGEAVIHEAADLIYHLFVMLAYSGVTLDAVEEELARRFGVSGLQEKASRRRGGGQA